MRWGYPAALICPPLMSFGESRLSQLIDIRAYIIGRPVRSESDVEQQLWLQREIEDFRQKWPPVQGVHPMPDFDWAELERQLTDLAATPDTAALVSSLVSASRKRSRGKPSEMVLREVLVLAGILQDESFQPGPLEPETDGEEFPMP
jgi:hypothetical protein